MLRVRIAVAALHDFLEAAELRAHRGLEPPILPALSFGPGVALAL